MTSPSIARGTPAPAPATPAGTKDELRAWLLARRRTLDDRQRAAADARIAARVLDWCTAHEIRSLGVYHAIRREPDLLEAYNALAAHGVHLALPVVVAADAPLIFRRWQPGDILHKDALGTMVPGPDAALLQPQALLVPCLGFTAGGLRLGYGGGFYDRTLATAPRPLAVGVCHAFGQVDFAAEPHDIPLDLVLTDAEAG